MDCREVTERLALFAYGDLPGDESDEVAAHVAACAECAARRERIEQTRSGLDAFTPIEAPADIGAIASWARASARAKPASSRRAAILGVAAGFVGFAVCSVFSARFESTDGGFVLSFGADAGSRHDEIVEGRVTTALERIEELQRAWLVAQDERYADVVNALRIEGERQRIHDSLRNQEFFDGVVEAVSFQPPRPHRP